ncbi:MAG: four helix bundle protein [Calditrichaeota bacterium]|nr:four helix bundle protein [Calditrichota bacterium]
MTEVELKQRTKAFALSIIKLVGLLPSNLTTNAVARQIVRSGTSVAANYRAACRGKSRVDFIAKLAVVEEEIDETLLWLELMEEGGILPLSKTDPLKKEANELISIIVSSIKTARTNK